MTYQEAINILSDMDADPNMRDEANEIVEAYENDGYSKHTNAGFNY